MDLAKVVSCEKAYESIEGEWVLGKGYVDNETQNDVRTFYTYLWQRHKDIIYSKYHFDLLTESLREKFEKLNLPNHFRISDI